MRSVPARIHLHRLFLPLAPQRDMSPPSNALAQLQGRNAVADRIMMPLRGGLVNASAVPPLLFLQTRPCQLQRSLARGVSWPGRKEAGATRFEIPSQRFWRAGRAPRSRRRGRARYPTTSSRSVAPRRDSPRPETTRGRGAYAAGSHVPAAAEAFQGTTGPGHKPSNQARALSLIRSPFLHHDSSSCPRALTP